MIDGGDYYASHHGNVVWAKIEFYVSSQQEFSPVDFFSRFLRNVSVLNFMNKIDVLKKKIENGADFGAAIKKIRQEALENAEAFSTSPSGTPFSHHDRPIYKTIADILTENPFDETFKVTGKLVSITSTINSMRLEFRLIQTKKTVCTCNQIQD